MWEVIRYILMVLSGIFLCSVVAWIGKNMLKEISRFIEDEQDEKEKAD